jgi:hypothetical protein
MFGKPKVHWLSSEGLIVAAGTISPFSPLPSSAAWELGALVAVIRRIACKEPSLLKGIRIRWFSDSSAATAIVSNWRTRSVGASIWLRELFALSVKYDFDVDPAWVSREAGWQPIADWLSRLSYRRKQAEYHLSREHRDDAITALGALPRTFDAFASPLEDIIVTSFATRWPCPGAFTDGFATPWAGKAVWAFPPFRDLPTAFAKIRSETGIDVVLVHPADVAIPHDLKSRVVATHIIPSAPLIRSGGGAMRGPCPVPLMCSHLV